MARRSILIPAARLVPPAILASSITGTVNAQMPAPPKVVAPVPLKPVLMKPVLLPPLTVSKPPQSVPNAKPAEPSPNDTKPAEQSATETKPAQQEPAEVKVVEASSPTGGSALTIPFRTQTAALQVIGAASTVVMTARSFSPIRLTTGALSVVGAAGTLPPAPLDPFAPVRLRTSPLQVIGSSSTGG